MFGKKLRALTNKIGYNLGIYAETKANQKLNLLIEYIKENLTMRIKRRDEAIFKNQEEEIVKKC